MIRYEQPPVLDSVFAYGSETLVPDHDICRVSYYLKCCIVGCGIPLSMNEALIDYQNAHRLPVDLQEMIIYTAFHVLNLDLLINRAFIVDDQHILLPQGTLNTFFEFKLASTYFSINSFNIASGHQVHVHKVMLCTTKWMKEYFIDPFLKYHEGNSLIETHAIRIEQDEAIELDQTSALQHEHPVLMITPETPPEGSCSGGATMESSTMFTCTSCNETKQGGVRYRCRQCPFTVLCEDCYTVGSHDQMHSFERIHNIWTDPEVIGAQAELLVDRTNSLVPDVPMAIAVRVDKEVADKSAVNEYVGQDSLSCIQ